ncbi:orotidine 5'-phosphate decarboxylase [Micrococcus luteus]|nr:orotidine 5'-phosphate decarboxylase [Micrococcus luteus]
MPALWGGGHHRRGRARQTSRSRVVPLIQDSVRVAGGVSVATIGAVRSAGAQVAVVGSAIYSAEDPASAAAVRQEVTA